MKEPEFELNPIEIPQERFDSELYRYDGDKTKHFWHGSYIKVDAVIDCLEKATSEYIIFSDIDIVVKSGVYSVCKKYMDEGYDMVYLKEDRFCNIGFMLLRTNGKALAFWKSVKSSMEAEMDLDQKYVNKLIETFDGKWGQFEWPDMVCTNGWDGESPYKVLQLLCSNLGKEFNMAEKIFYLAQQMELNNYMQYLDMNIVPYIYAFQDLLVRQMEREKEALAKEAEAVSNAESQ